MYSRLFKSFKKNAEAAPYPEFDGTDYKALFGDEVRFAEDVPISDTSKASLVAVDASGLYAFIVTKSEDADEIRQDVRQFLTNYGVPAGKAFTFIRTRGTDLFLNNDRDETVISIEHPLDRLECLLENNSRPLIDVSYIGFKDNAERLYSPSLPDEYKDNDGNPIKVHGDGEPSYVPSLLTRQDVRRITERLESAGSIREGGNEKHDLNGVRYRKFNTRTKLFGYSVREDWYPIADEDPDRYLLLTILGGWFGLHKFTSREYGSGIFYLLTFGGFGIFYLFDVLSILCGTYSVNQTEYFENESGVLTRKKTKVFLDKVSLDPIKWLALAVSAAIAFITFRYVYVNALEWLNMALSGQVSRVLIQ